jgi:uncharacterized membrane protein
MATVTVLKFPNPKKAAEALRIFRNLEKRRLIKLADAAMISWPAGEKSPTAKLLLPPLLAMAIEEGTSALFLVTANAVLDRVADAMKGIKFDIFATSLSKAQEEKLRKALAAT